LVLPLSLFFCKEELGAQRNKLSNNHQVSILFLNHFFVFNLFVFFSLNNFFCLRFIFYLF
jgi:hypothetical protein